jgi:hypothetical protein
VKTLVVTKKNDLFFLKTLRIAFLLAFVVGINAFESFGQTEAKEEKPNYTHAEEGPIFVSFGANLSKVYGKEFPIDFTYQKSFEGGLWLKYLVFDARPFYAGMEFQRRGYTYDYVKKGTLTNGKLFEDRAKGNVVLNYISIPFLFEIPIVKPESRFQVMAGLGIGLRVFFREKFEASRYIPQDSLLIQVPYEKERNDALDYLEFNLCFGLKYKILPRMEILAMGSLKGAGFSISKENFLTRTELHNVFSLKLLYKVTSLDGLSIL